MKRQQHDQSIGHKEEQPRESVGLQEMGTFRCDHCGEEFFIGHSRESVNMQVAEKQAKWLEKVFTDEHERDKKHSDRIELPD